MKKLFFFLILCFLFTQQAQALTLESGPQKTALVELYSSEGCSSCPPADNWISSLRNDPGLWNVFVPVAFHVTYWDYIGWKDPFASKQFTQRQRDYAAAWRDSGLYTPCIVVDGQALREWYQYNSVPYSGNEIGGILKVENQSTNRYKVTFIPPQKITRSVQAHIALLGFDVVSEVNRGENRGRTLKHDFITLDYDEAQMTKNNNRFETTLIVNDTNNHEPSRYGIAVWTTFGNNPTPIQSVGSYID